MVQETMQCMTYSNESGRRPQFTEFQKKKKKKCQAFLQYKRMSRFIRFTNGPPHVV